MDRVEVSRRRFLQASTTGLALAGLGGAARAQGSGTLVISNFGGEWNDWTRKEIDAEFKKRTGWSVNLDSGADNAARIAKIGLNLTQGTYDLGCFADAFFVRAENNGLLAPLDKGSAALTNLKDTDPKFITPHYASFLYNGLGMAYNPKLVKTPPTSWADMWNPEYRGRIILPMVNHSFGLHVVLLSAMAAGKSYKDLDAGFDKLKEMAALKPIWALDSQQFMRSLRDGEAAIGWIGRGEHLQIVNGGGDIKFVIPKEGGFLTSWGFAPIKTTKNMALAEQYINISLDPALQAKYASYWGFHPTNKRWTEHVPADVVKKIAFTPEEIERFVPIDYKWLDENRSVMTERWNRVVST